MSASVVSAPTPARRPSNRFCSWRGRLVGVKVVLACSFIDKAELDRVGCFKYSPVEGAGANDLPDQIPEEVKEERWNRFMQLQQQISAERLQEKVGREIMVIVDEVDEEGAIGRSMADAPEIDGNVYIDGVGTVITMSSSYGTTLGLDTNGMVLALLVTQLVAVPCSIAFSALSKKFGSLSMLTAAVRPACGGGAGQVTGGRSARRATRLVVPTDRPSGSLIAPVWGS